MSNDEQQSQIDSQEGAHEENRLIAERRAKLAELREAGNAFPNHFRRDFLAADLQAQYGEFSKEELAEKNIQVAVAGRMMLDRKAFKVLLLVVGHWGTLMSLMPLQWHFLLIKPLRVR